ncbi:hypothetical protein B0I03_11020 [Flavobacterium aquaticum]|uniref:Uncharacterized protein n=1 Tax=Flavobacterium aquaticum TaxID=1236486 RepID=A0A327YFC0_9FLAO|nr:hypothetical protein [Flavobacterium aquaticum]RAK19593.1 hypothetical protein B0I03_11020 [Flavobacterium aquaticum]
MEFLKDHKKITEKEVNTLKEYIIDNLKNSFQKNRTSEKAIEKLTNDIHNNLIIKSLISRYTGYFENCYRTLLEHNTLYDPKRTDTIYNTLEEEVYEIFQPKLELAIKQEYTKEDLIDLSYEEFVSHLLKYAVLKNVYNKLNSEEVYFKELLELFYELDDYSQFDNSLLKDHIELITYGRVQKIYLHYGKKLKAVNTDIKNSIKENQKEISSKFNNELYSKIENFNEDEKNIILHAFYKVIELKKSQDKKIDLVQFLRVIRICQGIDDIDLFHENYTKKFYKQVSEGLDYSSNTTYRKKLKKDLTNKLKDLQVPEVYNYINDLKD